MNLLEHLETFEKNIVLCVETEALLKISVKITQYNYRYMFLTEW